MSVKYRRHTWFDTKAFKPVYGIQARATDGRWRHCCEGSSPLLFDTESERDAKLEALREDRSDD